MGKIVYIYSLSEPETGQVRYIGKSLDYSKRFREHLSESNKKKGHKNNWIKSLLKKNLKPTLEIVDEVCENEWQYWEQYWISQFKAWGFNLTNSTEGGESGPALFGDKNPSFGKKRPGETILKIQNTFLNKSESEKQNLKKSISIKNSKPIAQYSKNMICIAEWESTSKASKKLSINGSHISEACHGLRKSAGGYIWKFKNNIQHG